MKKLLDWKVLLLLIVILAAFLRFYQLGSNPPSLTWDEVSWGYNAYSLGIDGKDEFGNFLPLRYLESFGDFKPPLYAYLDIIPVKIFGLNEFATRFPSAFFGTLSVLLTYFLVLRIFWKTKKANSYALLSSFFLAISPWHILLSRAAFEANIASFLIISAMWAFLVGVQNKKYLLILSAILFALSFYSFNTARMVSPILVLLMAIFFRKKLWEIKKTAVLSLVVGLMILLPILGFLFTPQANLRFKEVNIFSDTDIVKESNQKIKNDENALWSKMIHNRRVLYAREYLRHYFDNLNPSFLFIDGDNNPKFSTQNVGQLYVWDLPFFVFGILVLFRRREKEWWLIPLWLLIGIIPAGLARETPHALRIENSLPMFQILTAYGFIYFIDLFKNKKREITAFLFVLLFLNFIYFYHDYLTNYKYDYSNDWQYGYKDSIEYVETVKDSYDEIRVSDYLGRPYIYYLFYTKLDPSNFRKTAFIEKDVFGFVTVKKFGKYSFERNLNFKEEDQRILYIEASEELPDNINIIKTFKLLNNENILTVFTK